MFSIFFEHPFFMGIAFVLASIIVAVAHNVDPRIGEILGMNMVFPFVIIFVMICIMAILFAFLYILEAYQTRKSKREGTKRS